MKLGDVDTPAVVIERTRLERNIAAMAAAAREAGVALRPHAKTHKLPAIAHMQLAAGAVGITVAKVSEAEVMSAAGVGDVFIANEIVSRRKLARVAALARLVRVAVGVDSEEGAALLSRAAVEEGVDLNVRIEVDTGLNRCGVQPGEQAALLARRVVELSGLRLEGIFTHAGHVYSSRTPEERAATGTAEGEKMVETARLLESEGIETRVVSVGSTPTARAAANVRGVTEIRPGNYVFYDAMQVGLGAATWDDCALRAVATVVSRPAPGRAVIDAGSKVLGTERGANLSSVRGYGCVVEYPHALLDRLSEEHGVLLFEDGEAAPRIGERVTIIPAHACYVVNLASEVLLAEGKDVLARWPVLARGMVV
ncbi:MAG: alanine racemase [Chloroflexia bacterium]